MREQAAAQSLAEGFQVNVALFSIQTDYSA
jgi:hypothetical protein